MSIVVRDVREHELDSVLALNNAAGPAILPLDAARLRHFFDTAEYFRVAERDGTLAGFLIGMGSRADHDSSNFRWFRERYPEFFYIDRIVVASRRRGGGVGRAFYADVQSYAELRYPQLACEVFLEGTQRSGAAVPRQLRLPRSRPARDARDRRSRRDADEGTVQLSVGARDLRRRHCPTCRGSRQPRTNQARRMHRPTGTCA